MRPVPPPQASAISPSYEGERPPTLCSDHIALLQRIIDECGDLPVVNANFRRADMTVVTVDAERFVVVE